MLPTPLCGIFYYDSFYYRNTLRRNTKSTTAPRTFQEKIKGGEVFIEEKNDNYENNDDVHEDKVDVRKSENYLALSDTDTLSCYTVPQPIYPTLKHSYYLHTGERIR